MQKEHGLAMGADLRLAVAEHARALPLQTVARSDDVVDLVADVVDAAVGIALEKFRDRRALAERLEELDLGVGKRDKHGGDAMIGLRDRLRHLGSQRVAIDVRGLADVAHGNRNVVQPSDHAWFSRRTRHRSGPVYTVST